MKRLLFLLHLILLTLPLSAQKAEIQVSRQTTYLGQPVQILLVVTDGKADVPSLPESQNYSLDYQGVSTAVQSSIINGKSSQTVQRRYTWLLIPQKTGTIYFPSLKVNVEGKILETQPFSISVKEAREVQGTFVEYELPEYKIYPGQEIKVNIVWYFSMAVSSPHYSFPFLNMDNLSISQPPPPPRQNAELYTFNISGQQVYAERSAAFINGEQYSSLTFPWIVTVKEAGTYTLPPLGISMEVSTGRRDSWMNTIYEPAAIQSKKAELTVSTLPDEINDSPTGILLSEGELLIEASLDPLRAYVGDPLTLTVEFSNGLGLKNYEMPPLAQWKEVTQLFKVPSERSNGRYNEGKLTFNQTIRPKTTESIEFPSLRFLYLDVTTGKVHEAQTNPIEIQLESSSIVNSLDIEEWGEGESSPKKSGLEEYAEGIAAFIPWEKIEHKRFLYIQQNRIPLYMVLFLIPLLPFVIFLIQMIIKSIARNKNASFNSTKKRIQDYTRGAITLTELEKLLDKLESQMPINPKMVILREQIQKIRFSGLSNVASEELNKAIEELFNFWEGNHE